MYNHVGVVQFLVDHVSIHSVSFLSVLRSLNNTGKWFVLEFFLIFSPSSLLIVFRE